MTPNPIDPLAGPRYALKGRVVTMDHDFTVLGDGTVYINAGEIKTVRPDGETPPEGFDDAPLFETGGTLYPGLIELHNHLSYDILPLWNVPERYARREQWMSHPDKRKLITAPMQVLGKTPGYVEAIVRYVECKCLMSGVTTSQGLKLFGIGIDRYYRGITRNVEETDDPALPDADTRIADITEDDVEAFWERLKKSHCFLLHLCEGADEIARSHFDTLRLPDDRWAINSAFSGIHSTALSPEEFRILKTHDGSMIWSPLSNYLLYGKTADMRAAKDEGVLIGIGSDWSPSGSKNLLCELKAAYLESEYQDSLFSPKEIVAMATTNAALILKWHRVLGSIEAGKRADLLILNGSDDDPYEQLIGAKESSIRAVIINGVPRFGEKVVMKDFGAEGLIEKFNRDLEGINVGGNPCALYLKQETADEAVGELKLSQAEKKLKDGLNRLAQLAGDLERPIGAADMAALEKGGRPILFLRMELDEAEEETFRRNLERIRSGKQAFLLEAPRAAVPYSELLKDVKIPLDPLTVVDDGKYLENLSGQRNLPDFLKAGLKDFYRT